MSDEEYDYDGIEDNADDGEVYDEFDNWMNDAAAAGVELQNQAACLDDATSEERTLRDSGNIGEAATCLGG